MVLHSAIMFLISAVLLLIQIIVIAVAAAGCEEDTILEGIANCGVDPGVYYIPLVLLMLSSLALGTCLLLLWCLVREDDEEDDDKPSGNYYAD